MIGHHRRGSFIRDIYVSSEFLFSQSVLHRALNRYESTMETVDPRLWKRYCSAGKLANSLACAIKNRGEMGYRVNFRDRFMG